VKPTLSAIFLTLRVGFTGAALKTASIKARKGDRLTLVQNSFLENLRLE
jgi:hypothetical protein